MKKRTLGFSALGLMALACIFGGPSHALELSGRITAPGVTSISGHVSLIATKHIPGCMRYDVGIGRTGEGWQPKFKLFTIQETSLGRNGSYALSLDDSLARATRGAASFCGYIIRDITLFLKAPERSPVALATLRIEPTGSDTRLTIPMPSVNRDYYARETELGMELEYDSVLELNVTPTPSR